MFKWFRSYTSNFCSPGMIFQSFFFLFCSSLCLYVHCSFPWQWPINYQPRKTNFFQLLHFSVLRFSFGSFLWVLLLKQHHSWQCPTSSPIVYIFLRTLLHTYRSYFRALLMPISGPSDTFPWCVSWLLYILVNLNYMLNVTDNTLWYRGFCHLLRHEFCSRRSSNYWREPGSWGGFI